MAATRAGSQNAGSSGPRLNGAMARHTTVAVPKAIVARLATNGARPIGKTESNRRIADATKQATTIAIVLVQVGTNTVWLS